MNSQLLDRVTAIGKRKIPQSLHVNITPNENEFNKAIAREFQKQNEYAETLKQ